MFIMLIISWFCRSCVNKPINSLFELIKKIVTYFFSLFQDVQCAIFISDLYNSSGPLNVRMCIIQLQQIQCQSGLKKRCLPFIANNDEFACCINASGLRNGMDYLHTLLVYIHIILSKEPRNLISQNKSYVTNMLFIDIKTL